MNSIVVKKINGINFINSYNLWENIRGENIENRLVKILESLSCEFFDNEHMLLKKPFVGLTGIGGLPISWNKNSKNNSILLGSINTDIENIRNSFMDMVSFGAFNTYLNPNDKNPKEMFQVLSKYNHFSTLHTTYINVIIAGVSTSVENEFNSQRDLLHFCRLTEARTKAQDNPPFVVLYPELVKYFTRLKKISTEIKIDINNNEKLNIDMTEGSNLLHSASKTTIFLVSGTLRNFGKLLSNIDDLGKEEEYRRVLLLLNENLYKMFPDFFKDNSCFDFNYPKHWEK